MASFTSPEVERVREAIAWARTQGWRRLHPGRGDDSWGWTNVPRRRYPLPNEGRAVFIDISGSVLIRRPSARRDGWHQTHNCATEDIAQVLDLLAAARILPAVFSSQYRAGQALGAYLSSRLPCAHDAVNVTVV